METWRALSAVEQLTNHLEQGILHGHWRDSMPGVHHLAKEYQVNKKTVEAALLALEKRGLLVAQGQGRRRRIVLPGGDLHQAKLRIGLMVFNRSARRASYMLELRHLLESDGHSPFYAEKSLNQLRLNVDRVKRFVQQTGADAWVVNCASNELLKWFAEQKTPTFALFGGMIGLPIAGAAPATIEVFGELTRRLISMGHRRISFLVRRQHRKPEYSPTVLAYIKELKGAGIKLGDFNLPDWKESMEGFQEVLNSLFSYTPPTALILDEPYLYHAAHHFLAARGLCVPGDVSLICTENDLGFLWCKPSVAHIQWDYRPVVRRIVQWTNNIARGKDDRRQRFTKTVFVEGGSIGPPPTHEN